MRRIKGLVWLAVNDNVMGGRSSGGFELADGRLLFSGALNTDGGGFASIRTAPQPLDLGACTGMALRVRGDGRSYQFRLMTAATDVAQVAEFATRAGEWQTVQLAFTAFEPRWRGRRLDEPALVAADVVSIGLMIADGQDGPFALEVDWISRLPVG